MTDNLNEVVAPGSGSVSSSLSGAAHDVIQARDVHGGIHFHRGPAQVRVPRQLPGDAPGFVGRDREVERLQALGDEGRGSGVVAVVAGTAGAGKTALVVRVAHRIRERFPDGQLFVNLHGYDTGPPLGPQAALDRFLRALGLAPALVPVDLEERAELYRSLLAGRRMLVLLDNAATTGQVRPLLPGEPGCLVLITSRNRLSGLAVRDGAHRITLGLLPQAQAVQLVLANTAGYRTGDDPGQVAELVRLCARLPLALRIAAERAAARPWMPLRELIADLRDESALWDTLSAQDGDEADAVRAVFAWSYRALPTSAARAFRRLGLHPGPHLTTASAAAVTALDLEQTASMLDLLAGAHLLEQTGPQRYQFHDLLRAYAADQARREEDDQEQHAALQRLAAWYLHSALAATRAANTFQPPHLDGVPQSTTPLPHFDGYDGAMRWHRDEQANLLAVVRAAHAAGLDQIAWQLPVALHGLHVAHIPLDDWTAMATLGLDAAQRLGDRRAQALLHETLGVAHKAAGRLDQAADHHRTARDLFNRLGEQPGAIMANHSLGLIQLQQRDLQQARASFERTLAFARRPGNEDWSAPALCCLAYTYAEAGDLPRAAQLAEQSLTELARRPAAAYLRVDPLLLLARLEREADRHDQAADRLAQTSNIVEQLDHRALEHAVLLERAQLEHATGHHEQALELYWQYVNQQRSAGEPGHQALAFDAIGQTLHALGRLDEAIEFHRAAVKLSRHPADTWQRAVALVHLANAQHQTGQTPQAEDNRAEAHRLLTAYTDPRATALREHISPRQHDAT